VHPSENLTTPIKKSYENVYARREPGEHTKMQMQAWLSQMLAEPRSHMKMYRHVAARNLLEMRRQAWLYQENI
jgi:hypothetical protein